jgi:hypothetical protein
MMNAIMWIILWTIAVLTGFFEGVEAGHNEACKTIHTEWVKDKCMKVIREEVK